MALGLHLEHPPPRSVSLQRSKEIRLLSNQRHSIIECPVPDSFLSSLELSPPTSCPPLLCSGWAAISQEMVDVLDFDIREFASPIQDDDIPLPSTPSTPRFPPLGSPGGNGSFDSEEDEDVDIQIPLMTSLFFDDGGFTISFPRDRPCKILPHRDESAFSENQTFPRDVDALSMWGFSPSPTPRPTTPCFPPSSTSFPFESDLSVQTVINPPSSAVQPLSVAHELMRFHSKRRKQLLRPRTGSDRPSRRLPMPPPSGPDAMKGASMSQVAALMSPPTDELSIPVISPSKPKSRPLPPTPTSPPKPTPLMKVAACNFESSFLNLSSPCGALDDRMSLDLNGLVDIVDDMICNQRLSSFTIGEIGLTDPVPPLRRR